MSENDNNINSSGSIDNLFNNLENILSENQPLEDIATDGGAPEPPPPLEPSTSLVENIVPNIQTFDEILANTYRNEMRNTIDSILPLSDIFNRTVNRINSSINNSSNTNTIDNSVSQLLQNLENIMDEETELSLVDNLLESRYMNRALEQSFNEEREKAIQKRDKNKKIQFEKCTEYDKENNCPICLEKMGTKLVIAELNCKHTFHRKCVVEWGHYNNNCPVCRIEIPLKRKLFKIKRDKKKLE